MQFVLDASVAAAWALQDERSDKAEELLLKACANRAICPGQLWYEVRNALVVAERRGRMNPDDSDRFLADLENLPIQFHHGCDSASTMRLARLHKLSVYDAAYLQMAVEMQLPLATIDRKLETAARREGVQILSG